MKALVALCLVAGSLATVLTGQQLVFRAGVGQVRLDVLAYDRGKPLAGLTAGDFEVRDNGVLVTDLAITHSADNVSVAVALDLSQSIAKDYLDEMLEASEALVEALQPGDIAWLLTFANHLELRAGPVSNRARLREALSGLRPGGGTSLYDAMFGAIALAGNHTARSLTLVFTDGVDSTSWAREDRLLDAIRRSDVVFSVVRPRHAADGFRPLERAAQASGGVVLKTERGARLDSQFVDLLDEFRRGYVLSYSAQGIPAKANGWHDVEVKLKGRKGQVRTRPGYFEPGR